MLKLIRGGGKSGQSSKGGKQSKRNEKDKGKTIIESTLSAPKKKQFFMHAVVVVNGSGGPESLQVQVVPRPIPKANEVLVKVSFAGVNQPDIHQRQIVLPPDDDVSPYLGLECSGTIYEYGVGMSATDKEAWKIGSTVCGITNGGSYAQYVVVPIAHLIRVPHKISLEDAATFPQAACTVWSELFMEERLSEALKRSDDNGARLSSGETLLIHGGSSGIGTFAIQMAKHKGVTVFVTAGSDEKLEACRKLGADVRINYTQVAFEQEVLKVTGGKGVDVILDCRGEEYFVRNYSCLSSGGRVVTIGPTCNMAGQDSYISGAKRHIEACALRNRTPEMKAAIVEEVTKNVWPAIVAGKVKACKAKPKPFTFKTAADAHRCMEERNFIGKILLEPGELPYLVPK